MNFKFALFATVMLFVIFTSALDASQNIRISDSLTVNLPEDWEIRKNTILQDKIDKVSIKKNSDTTVLFTARNSSSIGAENINISISNSNTMEIYYKNKDQVIQYFRNGIASALEKDGLSITKMDQKSEMLNGTKLDITTFSASGIGRAYDATLIFIPIDSNVYFINHTAAGAPSFVNKKTPTTQLFSLTSDNSENKATKFDDWIIENLKGGYIMHSSSEGNEERVTINCLPNHTNILVYKRLLSPNISKINKEEFSAIKTIQIMGWNLTSDNFDLLENSKYQYILVKLPKNFRPRGKQLGYISIGIENNPILRIQTQEYLLLDLVDFVLGNCMKETE